MSILGRFQKNSTIRTMPKTTRICCTWFVTESPVCHCICNRNWRWVTPSVFLWRLGKTRDMLIVPLQSTASRPLQCGFSGERHYLHELRKQIKSATYMSWWFSRNSNGPYWSYTVGNGPYKGIIENHGIRKVGLSETHASGNREASTHNDWWKANWWNKYQQERSRRTWNDEVWEN